MVSVIVPVYNSEKSLQKCIDSILNQSYKDFELVLVDDGSLDNSGKICDDYSAKDSRVTVAHTKNRGVSSARNTGIDMAQGDFICFIDSDDYVKEDYLERFIDTYNQYPNTDSIWCGFRNLTDNNEREIRIIIASDQEKYSFYEKKQIMTLHSKWLSQMPWNKMFRSNIIIDNNIRFPEDLSLGEDLLFNLKYFDNTNGEIIVINSPLYCYVNNTGSLDNRYYSDLFEIYKRLNNELLFFITKWDCDNEQLRFYYNSCFYCYEKVLRNTFLGRMNVFRKLKYNRSVLKSEEFRSVFSKCDCYINPIYKICYRYRLCGMLRLLDLFLGVK